MPATQITTPPKAQVKPYDAAGWNAQDANNHRKAINDHAKQLDELVGPDGLVLPSALPAYTSTDAEAILALVQTQLDGRYVLVPPAPTPPASYSDTLSSSNTQVEGITADITGSQRLRVNPIAGVAGGRVTLELADTSDGARVSTFDVQHGYAGTFYKFQTKDGRFYEALFPANDQTISV
jgi:hypothetical protein